MPQLAKNARALYDYTLLDKFEGGLLLTGAEVKAAKMGHVNLKGAYLDIRNNKKGGELMIHGMHIGPYAPAGVVLGYNPTKDRKVLVHRREINKLRGKNEAERLTIVPVAVYTKGNLVKLEFALAKGKHAYEKRDSIKAKDLDREIRERMKA
jgi:SsrA-binding protein